MGKSNCRDAIRCPHFDSCWSQVSSQVNAYHPRARACIHMVAIQGEIKNHETAVVQRRSCVPLARLTFYHEQTAASTYFNDLPIMHVNASYCIGGTWAYLLLHSLHLTESRTRWQSKSSIEFKKDQRTDRLTTSVDAWPAA